MVNTSGRRRNKEGAQASVGDDAVFACVSMDEDYAVVVRVELGDCPARQGKDRSQRRAFHDLLALSPFFDLFDPIHIVCI